MSNVQTLLWILAGAASWLFIGHIVAFAAAVLVDDLDDPVLLVAATILWPFVLILGGTLYWGILLVMCVEKIREFIDRRKS